MINIFAKKYKQHAKQTMGDHPSRFGEKSDFFWFFGFMHVHRLICHVWEKHNMRIVSMCLCAHNACNWGVRDETIKDRWALKQHK